MFYVDIPADDLDDAKDIIAAHSSVVPYASYPHPSDRDFHRMEFEIQENRDQVKNCLGRFGIETYTLDA